MTPLALTITMMLMSAVCGLLMTYAMILDERCSIIPALICGFLIGCAGEPLWVMWLVCEMCSVSGYLLMCAIWNG